MGVERPLIKFRKFPFNSKGGFVIENLDLQSNQSRIEGIQAP
jgi:hypothetical protein